MNDLLKHFEGVVRRTVGERVIGSTSRDNLVTVTIKLNDQSTARASAWLRTKSNGGKSLNLSCVQAIDGVDKPIVNASNIPFLDDNDVRSVKAEIDGWCKRELSSLDRVGTTAGTPQEKISEIKKRLDSIMEENNAYTYTEITDANVGEIAEAKAPSQRALDDSYARDHGSWDIHDYINSVTERNVWHIQELSRTRESRYKIRNNILVLKHDATGKVINVKLHDGDTGDIIEDKNHPNSKSAFKHVKKLIKRIPKNVDEIEFHILKEGYYNEGSSVHTVVRILEERQEQARIEKERHEEEMKKHPHGSELWKYHSKQHFIWDETEGQHEETIGHLYYSFPDYLKIMVR